MKMAIGNPRLLSQYRSGIMEDNKKHEKTALGIAYAAVVELGYTHSQLVKLNEGVNFPTLRNIRDGKEEVVSS